MAILSIVSTQNLHIGVFLVENQLANWINFAAVPDLATGEQTSSIVTIQLVSFLLIWCLRSFPWMNAMSAWLMFLLLTLW